MARASARDARRSQSGARARFGRPRGACPQPSTRPGQRWPWTRVGPPPAATMAALTGERQLPNGAACGIVNSLLQRPGRRDGQLEHVAHEPQAFDVSVGPLQSAAHGGDRHVGHTQCAPLVHRTRPAIRSRSCARKWTSMPNLSGSRPASRTHVRSLSSVTDQPPSSGRNGKNPSAILAARLNAGSANPPIQIGIGCWTGMGLSPAASRCGPARARRAPARSTAVEAARFALRHAVRDRESSSPGLRTQRHSSRGRRRAETFRLVRTSTSAACLATRAVWR